MRKDKTFVCLKSVPVPVPFGRDGFRIWGREAPPPCLQKWLLYITGIHSMYKARVTESECSLVSRNYQGKKLQINIYSINLLSNFRLRLEIIKSELKHKIYRTGYPK